VTIREQSLRDLTRAFPLTYPGVAVEKLTHRKMVEKTLRWEALQTTISVLVDIFYLQNSGHFDKTGVFHSHRRYHSSTHRKMLFLTVDECNQEFFAN
jgi:hypothetical protein